LTNIVYDCWLENSVWPKNALQGAKHNSQGFVYGWALNLGLWFPQESFSADGTH